MVVEIGTIGTIYIVKTKKSLFLRWNLNKYEIFLKLLLNKEETLVFLNNLCAHLYIFTGRFFERQPLYLT